MIPPDHERRIKAAIHQVFILCLCAAVPPLFSLTGIFRPEDEPLGQWFQRSGAVMTVLAAFAQFKASGIATMIAGGTFAETWEAFHKYNRLQTLAAWLSLVLIVIGTLIWAYGDLLFPEPADDTEEQTAIVWCGSATACASLIHPRLNKWKGAGSPRGDVPKQRRDSRQVPRARSADMDATKGLGCGRLCGDYVTNGSAAFAGG
jgi:hypothetical protein